MKSSARPVEMMVSTGVLAADVAADGHEAVDGDVIPIVDVFLGSLDKLQFFLGVVDECAQFASLCLADVALEEFTHLATYISGSILQHVLEGLALTM